MKDHIDQTKASQEKDKTKPIKEKGTPSKVSQEKTEVDRSSVTGRKMKEDISGAIEPGSARKPDMLREDHPGLAK